MCVDHHMNSKIVWPQMWARVSEKSEQTKKRREEAHEPLKSQSTSRESKEGPSQRASGRNRETEKHIKTLLSHSALGKQMDKSPSRTLIHTRYDLRQYGTTLDRDLMHEGDNIPRSLESSSHLPDPQCSQNQFDS